MNKNTVVCALLTTMAVILIGMPVHATKYKYVIPSVPKPSAELQKQIAQYKQGNYTGAMLNIEELLKKNSKDDLARYYLALCYSQLGYKEKALNEYNKLAQSASNDVIKYYSEYASNCINDPDGDACNGSIGPKQEVKEEEEDSDKDKEVERSAECIDIENFIKSGQKVHPEARDRIIQDASNRRYEENKFRRSQQQTTGDVNLDVQSYNQLPTNEEIASALNVLTRLGMNPFTQMNNMAYMNNNMLGLYPGMNNSDISRMLMFSQYTQPYAFLDNQNNDLINYGM